MVKKYMKIKISDKETLFSGEKRKRMAGELVFHRLKGDME